MQPQYSSQRLLGGLFLIVFLAYGLGNGMVQAVQGQNAPFQTILAQSMQLRIGGLLVFSNSIFVVLIGILFFPILKEKHLVLALAYLISRAFEGLLLLIGAIALLSPLAWLGQAKNEAAEQLLFQQNWLLLAQKINFWAYQSGMICLGLGSLGFCWGLMRFKLVPSWLAIWGLLGYASLLLGAILEFFGFPLGIWFSIPGGLFELVLGIWLLVKGIADVA